MTDKDKQLIKEEANKQYGNVSQIGVCGFYEGANFGWEMRDQEISQLKKQIQDMREVIEHLKQLNGK